MVASIVKLGATMMLKVWRGGILGCDVGLGKLYRYRLIDKVMAVPTRLQLPTGDVLELESTMNML